MKLYMAKKGTNEVIKNQIRIPKVGDSIILFDITGAQVFNGKLVYYKGAEPDHMMYRNSKWVAVDEDGGVLRRALDTDQVSVEMISATGWESNFFTVVEGFGGLEYILLINNERTGIELTISETVSIQQPTINHVLVKSGTDLGCGFTAVSGHTDPLFFSVMAMDEFGKLWLANGYIPDEECDFNLNFKSYDTLSWVVLPGFCFKK